MYPLAAVLAAGLVWMTTRSRHVTPLTVGLLAVVLTVSAL